MRSENDAGPSAWSPELRIKTADGIPGPVENLNAEPTGPESGKITFEPPSEPNGEITGYSITYQLKSIGECGPRAAQPFTVHSKEPHYDLTNLIPDSTYEITVVAHTTQPGPKSKPVLLKTEEAGKFSKKFI